MGGGVVGEQMVLLALASLGVIYLLKLALLLLQGVWVAFLRPGKNLSKTYGTWAVVTGATDGIGRAFCFQLAKKRINVVLIGRSKTKLEDLVKEIQTGYGVDARYAEVDFTHPDLDAGMASIAKAVTGLEVGILINNVGMSYPYARFFHELDSELMSNLIRVNIDVTTRMVQLVLPGMLQRKRGAIINIGSGAASIMPADPLYTLYAATKAFVDQFSRSLYVEYKHSGIDVQCQVGSSICGNKDGQDKTGLPYSSICKYLCKSCSKINWL
ncbi:hypothetical protein O6H91_05G111800 [Diphasiastrum complanatum]|uniref:Uncharacterized protein n=1 Tax=Diphasiastrum complanatum TaxID=34168 RepID=A0ACC2DSN8_DIPCM|nr:hypothetical protein O6H91_05G111800 [Diphasiastrum complanatum]